MVAAMIGGSFEAYSPARTRASHQTALDVSLMEEQDFKSHPKFSKPSSVFSSNTARMRSRTNHIPGPGAYGDASPRTGGYSFGSARRETHSTRSHSVDAGLYNVSGDLKGREGSASAFTSTTGRHNPVLPTGEPGAYSPDHSVSRVEAKEMASVGFNSRVPKLASSINHTPAATAYTPRDGVTSRSAKSAVMPGSARWALSSSGAGPAPGTYNPADERATFGSTSPQRTAQSASFASATKRLKSVESGTPAPGAYEPSGVRSVCGSYLSQTPREKHYPKGGAHPGPGGYDSQGHNTISSGTSRTHTASFKSSSKRFAAPRSVGQTLGTPQSALSNKGSQFGIVERRLHPKPNDTPGPGTYMSKPTVGGTRGAVVPASRRDINPVKSRTPGPGAYIVKNPHAVGTGRSLQSAFRSTSPKSSAHRAALGPMFGATSTLKTGHLAFSRITDTRFKSNNNGVPGPGRHIGKYSSFLE